MIGEAEQRRLVEHLVAHIGTGLSGRDEADLVDQVPSRTLFAGVLQPVREVEEERAQQGASGDAPMGTSIGVECRIESSSDSSVQVEIGGRFSVYYAVFPSYAQTLAAQAAGATSALAPGPPPPLASSEVEGSDALPDGPKAIQEDPDSAADPEPATDDAEVQGSNEDVDAATDDQSKVILPRVWRRFDVVIPPQLVEWSRDAKIARTVGDDALAAGIDSATGAVAADSHRWRHLGAIKDRERSLGSGAVLRSLPDYDSALRSRGGSPVEPPPWSARIDVTTEPDPAAPDLVRLRVLLANTTPDGRMADVDRGLEERCLFDAQVSVRVNKGALVPFDFVLAPKDYRSDPRMIARGINCVVADDGARGLVTETLPVFRQPYYRTRDSLQIPFERLAGPDAVEELNRVGSEMDGYLATWNAFLKSEGPTRLSPEGLSACAEDRDRFREEVECFRLGIESLRRDPRLLDAFRLMNEAFQVLASRSDGRVRAWRLFQIGFICSQLPALTIRELDASLDDEFATRVRASLNEVGVLWFPTGGGKTEAYLGLIATSLLYDRLRGKTRGVSAWMRFPLRMLSLQQLDRLARVIAVLNELRSQVARLAVGDPFAIGYYVGDTNTPNRVEETTMDEYTKNKSLREGVRLVRNCPWCGSRVEVQTDRPAWRIAHVCTNPQCFSNTSTSLGRFRGSLPIVVVDHEIYRYLPSVLVGTVDKLAIAGSNRNFAHIVRGVTQECPDHGYASLDECIERWTAGCRRGRTQLSKLSKIDDPGPSLLIQDEFHLLRAELGVFNGHYEGLIRYLGARAHLPPKVLAATATIEAYDVQAFHIYLLGARRYPQPAWEQGESFYATSRPLTHRRFYVGVLNHARAIEEPALRALSLYQGEIRRLRHDLAAARTVMSTDATVDEIEQVLRLYDLSVCYVNRKATGGALIEKMGRVNASFQTQGLGPVIAELLTGDQTIDDVGAVIDRIEREREDTGDPRLDVVVATSLISHGVDLERINMMEICGMPSHYAEYVQASSRCGRSHPGVAFVFFNGRDPRERSQYEFFTAIHEHMDRLIEAVAVNRFASYAASKTVPGLLVGVLLSGLTPELFGSQIQRAFDHVPTLRAALGITSGNGGGGCVSRDDLHGAILRIIGVDETHPQASAAQIANARSRATAAFDDLMAQIARTMEQRLQEVAAPLTSFRDVDEGIEFGSIDSAGIVLRLRAR